MTLGRIRRRRMEGTETAALLDRLSPLPRLLLLVAWQAQIDAGNGCPEAQGWLDEMLPHIRTWLHRHG